MVDPRPETVDGDIKIVITPQLVHDIFEEYPVVAKAYNDNVPKQVSAAFSPREFVYQPFPSAFRGRVLATIFPVPFIRPTSSVYSVYCRSARREG